MVDLSSGDVGRGLPKTPCVFNTSELFVRHRSSHGRLGPAPNRLDAAKKATIYISQRFVMRFDSLTGSPWRLTITQEKKDWPEVAGRLCWMMLEMTAPLDDLGAIFLPEMARPLLSCGAFFGSGRAMSFWAVGDSRPRLFCCPLRCWHKANSVTEGRYPQFGYDQRGVPFIEMFRTMFGTTPQRYFRGRRSLATR